MFQVIWDAAQRPYLTSSPVISGCYPEADGKLPAVQLLLVHENPMARCAILATEHEVDDDLAIQVDV